MLEKVYLYYTENDMTELNEKNNRYWPIILGRFILPVANLKRLRHFLIMVLNALPAQVLNYIGLTELYRHKENRRKPLIAIFQL